jgi:hypothetical protein
VSRKKKIVLAVVAVLLLGVGYFAFRLVYTWRHLPEAYAAWDTGCLLVNYMDLHEGRWPTDWEDLLSVFESEVGEAICLAGRRSDETILEHARSLRRMVAIDWSFAPNKATGDEQPVTRPNGKPFPVVWSGAEPNQIVHEYLEERRSEGVPEAPR